MSVDEALELGVSAVEECKRLIASASATMCLERGTTRWTTHELEMGDSPDGTINT